MRRPRAASPLTQAIAPLVHAPVMAAAMPATFRSARNPNVGRVARTFVSIGTACAREPAASLQSVRAVWRLASKPAAITSMSPDQNVRAAERRPSDSAATPIQQRSRQFYSARNLASASLRSFPSSANQQSCIFILFFMSGSFKPPQRAMSHS